MDSFESMVLIVRVDSPFLTLQVKFKAYTCLIHSDWNLTLLLVQWIAQLHCPSFALEYFGISTIFFVIYFAKLVLPKALYLLEIPSFSIIHTSFYSLPLPDLHLSLHPVETGTQRKAVWSCDSWGWSEKVNGKCIERSAMLTRPPRWNIKNTGNF